ncbi:MAG: hypothetical protein RL441_1306 [Actinomycetota bacterium]
MSPRSAALEAVALGRVDGFELAEADGEPVEPDCVGDALAPPWVGVVVPGEEVAELGEAQAARRIALSSAHVVELTMVFGLTV